MTKKRKLNSIPTNYIKIQDLAYEYCISRQMIYCLKRRKKIEVKSINDRLYVYRPSFENYWIKRWDRTNSVYKGALVHDNTKDEYSVRQISDKFGLTKNSIYYFIYKKDLPFRKKGGRIVLSSNDFQH